MKQRKHILYTQPRAHTVGNVEFINREWVFFDEENDEAFLLEDIIEDGFELLYHNNWLPARFYEENTLQVADEKHFLQNGETIRIRKKLLVSYQEWLEELPESSFLLLTDTLQSIGYSLYDCIYCHNFLSFQQKDKLREGVNFLTFDNEDIICSVHHHYVRNNTITKDNFIFVKANGEQLHINI